MLARRFESLLADEVGKTDLGQRAPDDIPLRFESLRGSRLLPTGRTKNVTPLSISQMATTILSVATVRPGFAGLAGKVLRSLLPVGGEEDSFQRCATLGDAIERLLQDSAALDTLLEVRVSDSEMYTNAHGRGAITYQSDDRILTTYYVHPHAASRATGANFDSRDLISSAVTEIVFYPAFFRRIVREIERDGKTQPKALTIPQEDEDDETRKEQRAKRLGILPSSRFLHLGVNNQVTWPPEETLVTFEGYRLILMPMTRDHMPSISVDLVGQRITTEKAVSLINRFLSLLTWCDDNYAILQDGWSGNPVPMPVRKRSLGLVTAHNWFFDRKIPKSPAARKALALYREGRNAEQNYFISHAVLSYYKIFELKFGDFQDSEVRRWIAANYAALKTDKTLVGSIVNFEKACGSEKPEIYLSKACRVAVAHSSIKRPSDPDDLPELRRLHAAADILRALARRFISDEFHISGCPYDGS